MTKEKEVKEPERHEYKRAGYTGSSQQKERERKNRLVHHLAIDGGLGTKG